jgi:hypothetical protein
MSNSGNAKITLYRGARLASQYETMTGGNIGRRARAGISSKMTSLRRI